MNKHAIAPEFALTAGVPALLGLLLAKRGKKVITAGGSILGSGIGAVSGGLLGGGIAATSVTRPKVSGFLNLGANIADPLEKFGDVTQDITESIAGQIGRRTRLTPTIRTTTATDVFKFGVDTPGGKTFQESIFGPRKRKTKTIVSQEKKEPSKGKIIEEGKVNFPPDKTTPTFTPTPTPTQTETPTPINTLEQRLAQIKQDINVNVPTPTTTTTSTFIPTVAPIFRIPPPLPLTVPGGLGGSVLGKGSTKFVRELEAGSKVFASLLGGNIQRGKKSVKTKKRKQKR